MNFKKILTIALIVGIALCNSCNSDEKGPKFYFTSDGETISLNEANLFLVDMQYVGDSHLMVDYLITDGTIDNFPIEQSWSLSNLENASYFILVRLASPGDGSLEAGNYPLHPSWYITASESNFSDVYASVGDEQNYVMYYSNEGDEEHAPTIVTGEMGDGDTMSLRYNGKLNINGEIIVSCKFYYQGVVADVRP